MFKVLVLDDDATTADLASRLVRLGYLVAQAPKSEDALSYLAATNFDFVVLKRNPPSPQVDRFLQQLTSQRSYLLKSPMLLLEKRLGPESAAEFRIPGLTVRKWEITDEQLSQVLAWPASGGNRSAPVAVSVSQTLREAKTPVMEVEESNQEKFPIIGTSPAFRKMMKMFENVAATDATVLLQGESGTGKDVLARELHRRSSRNKGRFVTVQCGCIPPGMLESELFGHEKGAFTGALNKRIGKFLYADGGTLLLDEIGDLPLDQQVKLLRALQEGEIQAVGSNEVTKVNVRIIAATNQNLEHLIEKKLFREDLYYRLNVVPIYAPSLRERREDIPQLIQFFVHSFNQVGRYGFAGFTPDAMEALTSYPWPGNIRELANTVERMAILGDGQPVDMADIPPGMQRYRPVRVSALDVTLPEGGLNLSQTIDQLERSLYLQALERTRWDKSKAARLLGLNRTTLIQSLKRKGITRSDGAEEEGDEE